MIPHYVGYCLKFTKKRIKKELKKHTTFDTEKLKLLTALIRLLFKNIISKMLNRIAIENQEYLSQLLNYGKDSEVRKNVENYLPIIGELLDRIAGNSPINSDFLINQNGESTSKNLEDGIIMLNNVIKTLNRNLQEIFTVI